MLPALCLIAVLAGCSTEPPTTTSPVSPAHSVCARLFGDPLPAEWAPDLEPPALIRVVGDPGYELRCFYGIDGVREFVIAVTRLDASITREKAIGELVGRGYALRESGADAVLISPARVGSYAGDVDLIDDRHWIRVTVVSPDGVEGGVDHAEAVRITVPWLARIREALGA